MAGSDDKAEKVAVFRARQLLKEKRYADALQVCTDELARGRDDPQLRLIAAHSLMAQGRHEGAKKEAQLVIRVDPNQAEAYRILADVACTRGELATACEHLQHVLKLDPGDAKSKSLLETLSRPAMAAGDDSDPGGPDRGVTPSTQEELKSTSAARFVEASAPAVELSDDDLVEEEDSDAVAIEVNTGDVLESQNLGVDEEPTTLDPVADSVADAEPAPEPARPPVGDGLFPPSDSAVAKFTEPSDPEDDEEPHVDPFSGEIFQVTDSMMEQLPEEPSEDEGGELEIRSRDEAPPPGLRTEHDLPLVEKEAKKKQEDTGTVEAVKAEWGDTSPPPGPQDVGVGGPKYQATLRLPSLDELPDDEDAPTMPLLRPSAPPAPQLKLDPLASKPVSHEKVHSRAKPADSPSPSPPPPTQPPLSPPPSRPPIAVKPTPVTPPRSSPPPMQPGARQPGSPRQPGPPMGPLPTDAIPEVDVEEFAVEPASVPLERPDPQPIPRHTLDPIRAQQAARAGRPPGPPDPLAMMTGDAPDARGRPPSRQHPPVPETPQETSGNMLGMLAGGEVPDPSFPSVPAAEPVGMPEPPADDLERQLMEAGLSGPDKERGHGLRWFLIAVVGLLIGGGGLFGYLWYRSYKYVKGEFATLRTHVHRSTPDGFRQARKAAERILAHKKGSVRARAALAMCDAAMSIEFGDDRLKDAREALEATKGTDSEWRTAANAFLALMDDPGRATGYLQKGLEVYPESALLLYLKGRALGASGQPERAGESFQAALKRAPKFVAAKTALAQLVGRDADRLTEAVSMLDEVLSKNANNVQALIDRARLRARHGKELDLAVQDARRVTEDLASKAGKGQVGWGYLVLARAARLQGQHNAVASQLDQAAASPPCCDSSFAYELAGEMMSMYRMGDAQTQMTRALELKPKKAEFLQRMARVMLELDNPKAAATYLKSAPARQVETRLLQGRLYYAQRRYSKAISQLKRVLNEEPKQVEAQIYIALANARRRKTDDAVRQLQRLAAHHPREHSVYAALAKVRLWSGELDHCHAALKKSWAITKLDPSVPTIAGHMYLKQHDIATAAKRFARALRAQPDYRPAHLGLARTYVLTGDLDAARAELKKIPEPQRKRFDVYAATASIELAAGNTDTAHAAVAQAEAAGAPKGLVAKLAGQVALVQRKGAEAVALLQRAVKSMGRDVEAMTLLARAQHLAGQVDNAYDSYNLALRYDGGYPEALVGLSRIAIRDREYFIAIKRVNDALKKIAERGRPQTMKAEAHTVLGLAYLRQGDTGRAITNLQDAMELDPNLGEPHYLMGQTYDRLDRPQRAIPFYDKALKLDATLVDAYYRLGRAYAKGGDAANAVRYYQDYLNRNPPQARAQEVAGEIKRLQQQ